MDRTLDRGVTRRSLGEVRSQAEPGNEERKDSRHHRVREIVVRSLSCSPINSNRNCLLRNSSTCYGARRWRSGGPHGSRVGGIAQAAGGRHSSASIVGCGSRARRAAFRAGLGTISTPLQTRAAIPLRGRVTSLPLRYRNMVVRGCAHHYDGCTIGTSAGHHHRRTP